jgi:hypothetical protein
MSTPIKFHVDGRVSVEGEVVGTATNTGQGWRFSGLSGALFTGRTRADLRDVILAERWKGAPEPVQKPGRDGRLHGGNYSKAEAPGYYAGLEGKAFSFKAAPEPDPEKRPRDPGTISRAGATPVADSPATLARKRRLEALRGLKDK